MNNFKKLLGFLFICILLSSTVVHISDLHRTWNGSSEIVVVYDSTDITVQRTALAIAEEINTYYPYAKAMPVKSKDQLHEAISFSTWAVVYVFHGDPSGIRTSKYGNSKLSWMELAHIIDASPVKHHILTACHSNNILKYVSSSKDMHVIEGLIDAKIAMLDSLLALSDLMKGGDSLKVRASESLSTFVVNYFLDNFLEILLRAFQPMEPLEYEIPEKSGYSGFPGYILDLWLSEVRTQHTNVTRDLDLKLTIKFRTPGLYDWFELTIDTKLKADRKFEVTGTGEFKPESETLFEHLYKGCKEYFKTHPGLFKAGIGFRGVFEEVPGPLGLIYYVRLEAFKFLYSLRVQFTYGIGSLAQRIPTAAGVIAEILLRLRMVDLEFFFAFLAGIKVEGGVPSSYFEATLGIGFGVNIRIAIVANIGAGMDISGGAHVGTDAAYALSILYFYLKFVIDLYFTKWETEFGITTRKKWTGIEEYPTNLDSDGDGLPDSFEDDPIGSDPNKKDTDADELDDDYEVRKAHTNPLDPDTDHDGLKDGEEVKTYHTNPTINDTDGDRLLDGEEVNTYKTNPAENDSDRDGLSDYEEVKTYGTDPLNKDTDGDGLGDGMEKAWLTNSTLHPTWAITDITNISKCLNSKDPDGDGLNDGPPDSISEYKYNTNPLDIDTDGDADLNNDGDTNDKGIWIDLNRNGVQEGNETFDEIPELTDGNEIKGNYWPYNGTIDTTRTTSPWDYAIWTPPGTPTISKTYPWPVKTSPNSTDTDGDGLADFVEWTWNLRMPSPFNQYNPVEGDTDGDGLKNGYETPMGTTNCSLGTDPNKQDTDDDGIIDGLEMAYWISLGVNKTDLWGLHTRLTTQDFDGDGLLDGEEKALGTRPDKVDTDDDRLGDFREVKLYGTNPLRPDTDGDGLTDYEEVKIPVQGTSGLFTDPLNRDCDGDGLLDGEEVKGMNVTICIVGQTPFWKIVNTNPLDPDTDHDGLTDFEEVRMWVWNFKDVIKLEREGYWKYFGGEKVMYIPPVWSITKEAYLSTDALRMDFLTDPSDPDTDDDGLLDGNDEKYSYLTNPLNIDTDGDGLKDGEEVSSVRAAAQFNLSDPLHFDSDGDQLNDFEELRTYSTDPWKNDTDNDKLTDYIEVTRTYYNSTLPRNQTDPLNPDTDGDALLDGDEVRGINMTVPVVSRYLMNMTTNTTVQAPGPYSTTLRTNPLNPDTDGDGLNDYEEINKYHTDPMSRDTDTDQLTDGEETKTYHTDPLNPDTDGDGKYDGLEVKHLKPPKDPLNPDENKNGIPDGKEQDFDNDGISDYDEAYEYKTPFWDEDADKDGLLDGEEIKYHTGPLNSDTDLDGLLDGEEVKTYGTDPLNKDTDGDTLIDGDEVKIYHTNPLKADTDNDGLTDNRELAIGTDPLRQDTDGDLWPDGIDPRPLDALIPDIFVVVAAVAIGTGFYYFKRRRRIPPPAVPKAPTPVPEAKHCIHCGAEMPVDAVYCVTCGREQ